MSPAPENISSNCTAMSDILNRIGDKWSVMVVGRLRQGPVRFNTIKRDIGGISQRMLTLTLRNLERDGLATRTVFPEIPPRVEYELTDLGQSLQPAIGALWDWATTHHKDVTRARARYDADQEQPRHAAQ